MQVIKKPITGDDFFGDALSPTQSLTQFYFAFNDRDVFLMSANWAMQLPELELSLADSGGKVRRGWNEIRAYYDAIFKSSFRMRLSLPEYTLHQHPEVTFAVGVEHAVLTKEGGEVLEFSIRSTRILKRIGGRWKQVHYHGSIDDPEALKALQELLPKA